MANFSPLSVSRPRRWLILAGVVALFVMRAEAFQRPARARLPNLDKREEAAKSSTSAEQKKAAAELRERVPNATVEFDRVTGSPRFVSAGDGFLSGPDAQGKAISPAVAATIDKNDPHRATKAFLKQHAELFGHGPEALDKAAIKREFTTANNGLKTVVWEQRVDDIRVFEA